MKTADHHVQYFTYRRAEHGRQYREARAERIRAMGRRFTAMMQEQGFYFPDVKPEHTESMRLFMHNAIRYRDEPRGWVFESALEAADVFDGCQFQIRAPVAALRSRPGTLERIDELAARLQRGEELWHPEDRNCFDTGEEEIQAAERRAEEKQI
jgi:hypothetical protein